MLPHLDAVSLVDEFNRYHLPLWLTSAPATLKALIAYGDSFYHEYRALCSNVSEREVYRFIENNSNVFPGLVQLCLYNMYAPPERFEAPHLHSLALLNDKLSFASNFYDSIWTNFLSTTEPRSLDSLSCITNCLVKCCSVCLKPAAARPARNCALERPHKHRLWIEQSVAVAHRGSGPLQPARDSHASNYPKGIELQGST